MGQKIIIIIATTILLFTGLLLGYVLSQLVLGYLKLNLLTFLGTFSLILIFGTLYYVLFWELRRQSNQLKAARAQTVTQPNTKPVTTNGMENRLKKKLVMLAGSTAEAERLLEKARQDYPENREIWYLEKVIGDLERDRR